MLHGPSAGYHHADVRDIVVVVVKLQSNHRKQGFHCVLSNTVCVGLGYSLDMIDD